MEQIEILEIIEEIVITYIDISHCCLLSTERRQILDFLDELKNKEITNE